jgi:hypothetical protein
MLGLIVVGAALEPLRLLSSSWPWVFYLNVPIGGVALVTLFAFLRVKSDTTPNYLMRL